MKRYGVKLRKRVKYDIQGTPLSELGSEVDSTRLQQSVENCLSDYLLISQPDSVATALASYYKSKSVRYCDMLPQLSSDVHKGMGLGSIAYEPVEDYAEACHDHTQYSGITVVSYCSNRSESVQCSLVTFEDDGFSENVSIPHIRRLQNVGVENLQMAPQIGELRMFGVSNAANLIVANQLVVDMSKEDFSGWAFPLGQAIDKSRFPGAYQVFGSNLPVIDSQFMKLNPFTVGTSEGENAMQTQNAVEEAEVHMHQSEGGAVAYKNKGTKTASIPYKVHYNINKDTTEDWSNATADSNCTNALEYGYRLCKCTEGPLLRIAVEVEASIKSGDVSVLPAGGSGMSYPSYTPVIALVYVGKPGSNVDDIQRESNKDELPPDSSYPEYKA